MRLLARGLEMKSRKTRLLERTTWRSRVAGESQKSIHLEHMFILAHQQHNTNSHILQPPCAICCCSYFETCYIFCLCEILGIFKQITSNLGKAQRLSYCPTTSHPIVPAIDFNILSQVSIDST